MAEEEHLLGSASCVLARCPQEDRHMVSGCGSVCPWALTWVVCLLGLAGAHCTRGAEEEEGTCPGRVWESVSTLNLRERSLGVVAV